MRTLEFVLRGLLAGALLAGWTGCQQSLSTNCPCHKTAQCPPGCDCPKCPKKCDKDAKAHCPKAAQCCEAGKAGCNPAACPTAKTCFLDHANGPKGEGWIPLCNGKDMGGWKSMSPDKPMSWKVVDGVMVNEEAHGVNIYTEKTFGDFEFYAEYKLPPGGNSGIFLRGLYEIQIIDDFGTPVDKPKDSGNGGLWSLKSPSKNVSKPAGQWQSIYARLEGNTVTVILNGEKIIDHFKLERPTHLYAEMKHIKHGEPGPILLQGDHKPIEYRHVMLRPIAR